MSASPFGNPFCPAWGTYVPGLLIMSVTCLPAWPNLQAKSTADWNAPMTMMWPGVEGLVEEEREERVEKSEGEERSKECKIRDEGDEGAQRCVCAKTGMLCKIKSQAWRAERGFRTCSMSERPLAEDDLIKAFGDGSRAFASLVLDDPFLASGASVL